MAPPSNNGVDASYKEKTACKIQGIGVCPGVVAIVNHIAVVNSLRVVNLLPVVFLVRQGL